MAFTYPIIRGRITITASYNDVMSWYESDGAGHTYNLSITLTAGSYYPETLATDLAAAMSAYSDTNGVGQDHAADGINYTISIAETTGIVTITAANGVYSPVWYPRIKTTESYKFLTGGDWSIDAFGDDNFGWKVDSAYPAAAANHSSDFSHGRGWIPDQPASADDLGNRSSHVVESVTLTGKSVAFDFSGDSDYLEKRSVRFEYLSSTSRSAYLNWWNNYGKQGCPDGRFRYYPDRATLGTYYEMGLAEESLKDAIFERTVKGYLYFSMQIKMRLYKA